MSKAARERAAELGERPDIQRWIKRLKKLSDEMPEDVYIFCEGGSAHVMAKKHDGDSYETETECEDPDAVIGTVWSAGKTWDGGGW